MKMNDKILCTFYVWPVINWSYFYKKRFDFLLNIVTYKMSTFYKVFYTLIFYSNGYGFEQGYAYWKSNEQFTS